MEAILVRARDVRSTQGAKLCLIFFFHFCSLRTALVVLSTVWSRRRRERIVPRPPICHVHWSEIGAYRRVDADVERETREERRHRSPGPEITRLGICALWWSPANARLSMAV